MSKDDAADGAGPRDGDSWDPAGLAGDDPGAPQDATAEGAPADAGDPTAPGLPEPAVAGAAGGATETPTEAAEPAPPEPPASLGKHSSAACRVAPPPGAPGSGPTPPQPNLILFYLLAGCLFLGMVSLVTGPTAPEAAAKDDEYELFTPQDLMMVGRRPEGVAVVRVDGGIQFSAPKFSGPTGADRVVDVLRRIAKAKAVKAVVLRVNSPGGTVAASQEIAEAVREVKAAGKKVVVSMADMAASGGYYISAPADYVFALPGTITGSIGVITSLPRYKGVAEKVGYTSVNFTSGPFKDMGNPMRDLREDESALFKDLVMSSYLQFVEEVARGRSRQVLAALEQPQDGRQWKPQLEAIRAGEDDRPLEPADAAEAAAEKAPDPPEPGAEAPPEGADAPPDGAGKDGADLDLGRVRQRVSELADGRIYTGYEAHRLGLVDEIGGLRDAIRKAGELTGLGPEPVIMRPKSEAALGQFFQLMGRAGGGLAGVIQRLSGVAPPAPLPATAPVAYLYLPGA